MSTTGTFTSVNNLQKLVQELHKEFQNDKVCIETVEQILTGNDVKPAEWEKFAKFAENRYTKNLVDEGNGKFNVVLVCWEPNTASPIHNHADCHCFMKMVQGELLEVRYNWPTNEEDSKALEEVSRTELTLENISYINDSLGLHKVGNNSTTERAISLHVYSPPIEECQVFNQTTGKPTIVPASFWSKFGEQNG